MTTRDEFEKWARRFMDLSRDSDDQYYDPGTTRAWHAWQYSSKEIDALKAEIERPQDIPQSLNARHENLANLERILRSEDFEALLNDLPEETRQVAFGCREEVVYELGEVLINLAFLVNLPLIQKAYSPDHFADANNMVASGNQDKRDAARYRFAKLKISEGYVLPDSSAHWDQEIDAAIQHDAGGVE